MTEPTTRHKSGTVPNTLLHLDAMQRAWLLKTFGGYQQGIRELVEAAMTGTKPRLEKLRRRQARRTAPIDKTKEE